MQTPCRLHLMAPSRGKAAALISKFTLPASLGDRTVSPRVLIMSPSHMQMSEKRRSPLGASPSSCMRDRVTGHDILECSCWPESPGNRAFLMFTSISLGTWLYKVASPFTRTGTRKMSDFHSSSIGREDTARAVPADSCCWSSLP